MFTTSDKNIILSGINGNVLLTGCARPALRIIVEYFHKKGILRDRNDEVLVPRWLFQSVLYVMHRYSHPVLTVSKNIRCILVFHQFGFPQNMEEITRYCASNNISIIEDCANTYDGYYNGKRLGTFGHCSIFSFPKLFPSLLGGALVTNDDDLYQYGIGLQRKNKYSHLTYAAKLLYECLKHTKFSPNHLQEMIYTKYDIIFQIKYLSVNIINRQLTDQAILRKRDNFRYFVEYFKDRPEYFQELEKEGVTPYLVPLFDKEKNLKKIKQCMGSHYISAQIYNFDINRNLLDPRYRKCTGIPVHQGLTERDMDSMGKIIRGIVG